ncbi:MAG: hypothetical protein M1816_005555 [Peltula sp. TS41687]|nr:MAG: hypothetical protein M1816_005555 [Peltula sp. TS41687]
MSTLNSSITAKVPRLSLGNYDTWKTRMEMLSDPGATVGDCVNGGAQHEFDDEADRATAIIFLYLDESAERLVRDTRDPVELWKRLKDMCSAPGSAIDLSCGVDSSEAACATMCRYSIRRQLKDAGFEVHDEIMATILLKGLPKSFDDFVTHVTDAYGLSEAIRYDGLIFQLTEECKKTDAVVATASKNPNPAPPGASDPRVRCNNCGRRGHKARQCTTRPREQENNLLGGDFDSGPTPSDVVW